MATEWELARATGRCALTGRTFEEGEAYYAVLFDTPAGLERRDYSLDAWTGPPEGAFCHWRGRVPVREKKSAALEIDQQMLTQLFVGLEDEQSESRQQFRFVLALLLMRKRVLRFEQAIRKGEQEYWQMRLLSDKSLHQVLNPRLDDQQVSRLSAQLTALLSGEIEAIEILNDAGDSETLSGEEHVQTLSDASHVQDQPAPGAL
ncbi:MAG TPA: hypothetical protein PKG54_12395 [Phycisphaerae bacterium]|jgi:hypothetical protein|nr:hypothetical protein [Phycisphaerae bacterium]HOB75310.1 hypothetical protein [Phycisphaerae bacterium]HOJ53254.1 hypothetical protein [Phycisphaerae bacterium]HOL25218.1 hypothetical protein [Phycisphaerae bacterium]HPP20228.1 hypothetical protein [Phycisphaerae bacterium]